MQVHSSSARHIKMTIVTLSHRNYGRSIPTSAGKWSNRPIVKERRMTNVEHDSKAKDLGLGFRTVVSGILHRYPTITPEIPEWDKAMQEVQQKINLKKLMEMNEAVENSEGSDILPDVEMSIDEMINAMPFQPASRSTLADEENDRHSTDRRLADSLFLLVKRNRDDKSWQFPQGKLRDEETLRSGAERITDRAVGSVERWFVGNAPIGHYVYAYPEALQKQRNEYGAKVFFYRSQLCAGNIKLETRLYTDFAWVARDEIEEYLDPETSAYMSKLLSE